jgi:ABC-type uncharacterized transport system permease subunit
MSIKILFEMFPIALMFASPIIIAALGGLFSERSGVVNIALEGIMMVGAFSAATVTVLLEESTVLAPWLGLAAGLVAGIVFSLLHAVASVNMRADQTISGTALNILAGGLTVYLCQIIFRQQRTRAFSNGIQKVTVPLLEKIPVLGRMFFIENYRLFSLRSFWSSLLDSVYKTHSASGCGPAESIQGGGQHGLSWWHGCAISASWHRSPRGPRRWHLVLTADIKYTW